MNEIEFKRFVGKLVHYYNRKTIPTTQSLNIWLQEVERIPAEALDFIFNHIKQGDSFPGNLPKAMRDGWQEWIRANGKSNGGFVECEDGCDRGILFVWHTVHCTGFAFRCARCNQSDLIGIPAAKYGDLVRRGYERQ